MRRESYKRPLSVPSDKLQPTDLMLLDLVFPRCSAGPYLLGQRRPAQLMHLFERNTAHDTIRVHPTVVRGS